MAVINGRRVLWGVLAGGVVWTIWSMVVNLAVLVPHYAAAQQSGAMRAQPRYPFFVGQWIVLLFVLAYIIACSTLPPGRPRAPDPKPRRRSVFLWDSRLAFPATSPWRRGLHFLASCPCGGCWNSGSAPFWLRW